MKTSKCFLVFLSAFLLFILLCWILFFRYHLIYSYHDQADRYGITVNVMAYGKTLYFLDFEDRYVLEVAYGKRGVHYFDVSLFNDGEDVKAYLKKCQLSETLTGFSFTQPTGHIVFVPKAAYEAGR